MPEQDAAEWALDWLDARFLGLEAEAMRHADIALADAARDALRAVRQVFQAYVPSAAWSSDDANYAIRMGALMEFLAIAVDVYAGHLRNILEEHGRRGYYAGYYGACWMAAQVLPKGARGSVKPRWLINPQVADALAAPWGGNDTAGRVARQRLDVLDTLRKELISSQLAKEGLQQAERRALRVFDVRRSTLTESFAVDEAWGQGFDGYKTTSILEAKRGSRTARGRSVRASKQAAIARMEAAGEVVHARSLAATTAFNEMEDVIKGWKWVTSADRGEVGPPVCEDCQHYSGREFFLGTASVIPPLHNSCNCIQTVITRSLAEIEKRLGIDMSGEAEGFMPRQSFGEWASEAGIPYDGGLSTVKPRVRRAAVKKSAATVKLPPPVDRAAMVRARHAAEEQARRAARKG